MKSLFTFFGFFLMFSLVFSLNAQGVQTDSLGFETFTYREGDTTYLMKKYFLVLLKTGEKRSQDKAEALEIQKGHLAHLAALGKQGYLDLAGPMGDEGALRGILVLRVPTMERAMALVDQDPAVQAGRLKVEVHPWWAAQGSCLQ